LPSDLIILIGKKHVVIHMYRALGATFVIERRHCKVAFGKLTIVSFYLYRIH